MISEPELLLEYFKLYQKQTKSQCPYHNPSLKRDLQGINFNGMLIFDAPKYRRISTKQPTDLECSVLFTDLVESFDNIKPYTIVIAKKILTTSSKHIVVTSELTELEAVNIEFKLDELTRKHLAQHKKKFYIPELLDLHLIDGFVPFKNMEKFVAKLDSGLSYSQCLSECTEYPGSSRMRVYTAEELENVKSLNISESPIYQISDKLDLHHKLRRNDFGCPFPSDAMSKNNGRASNACPVKPDNPESKE
eukprot:NODE_13_length_54415_cov_0.522424.p28 type:complete len:249 gc:universal NODE_13_length_54415_cov_0.522424:15976-15230(-)